MSNSGINFFIDVILLLCAALIVGRMLQVGIGKKRDDYLKKHNYRVGSPEYARVMGLTSPRLRKVATIVTPIIILKTAYDVYSNLHTRGVAGTAQMLGILAFIGVLFVGVGFAIYGINKES